MGRPGGVNFSLRDEDGVGIGYRKNAMHEIHVDLETAIENGIKFLENRFSNIIFGAGKWDQDWWDGKVPMIHG